jgi:hypothetical protein
MEGNTEVRWIESESLEKPGKNLNADDDTIPECFDLFADPDPYQTFSFSWRLTNEEKISRDDEKDSEGHVNQNQVNEEIIKIEVSGYKAELGQTLHSTGLTLWRASELLCNFMIAEKKKYISNKSILEVR